MIKRIAITGPESTGKSILTEQLAKHFQAIWVPEYARTYLDSKNGSYTYADILKIAKTQLAQMEEVSANSKDLIFFDTELIVTKIWCEFKYGKCHPWITKHIPEQNIDLYLLMNIDLPWQPDPQREHPDKRNILFNLYKEELEKQNFPYQIISGTGRQRTDNAINAIRRRFH